MHDTDSPHIVERVASQVAACYVFADVGERIADVLRSQLATGRYGTAGDLAGLADLVTEDLRSVNGDKHLGLRWYVEKQSEIPDEELVEEQLRLEAARTMAGVPRVEQHAGNVALVELSPALYAPSVAGEAVTAAMTLASRADALVLDVRANHGGDPKMVAFVCTYLFGDEPVHLADMYEREEDRIIQSWTLPYVPGVRFGPDRPVRVLTSSSTFSGDEELAYDLQQLGRAKVVGERTGGGANPLMAYQLHPNLRLLVPTGRAINPLTGTNWEGTGVTPDIEVPAADALKAALASLPQPEVR